MINTIKQLLLGVPAKGQSIYDIKCSFTTALPTQFLSEYDWYNEFRVGCLHNKLVIHFG
jgi:hypothetical protein